MSVEPYQVRRGRVAESGDYEAFTLVSVASGREHLIRPRGRHGGVFAALGRGQLLGLRKGIETYVAAGKTFGIPLLAPWANRLGSDTYTVAGVEVDVSGTPGMHRDGNGYPIHGLVAGSRGWKVTEFTADHNGATLTAVLAFDAHRMEFQAFPFPHELQVSVHLHGHEVAITTQVTPTGQVPVPITFGWHPYFVIPDQQRADWRLHLPLTERAELDAHNLPTGKVVEWSWEDSELGTHVVDDVFVGVEPGTVVSLAGGEHNLELEYQSGYPYAVIFAPAEDDVVAIEPMTAPSDPFSGTFPLRTVPRGESYAATYVIRVDRAAP